MGADNRPVAHREGGAVLVEVTREYVEYRARTRRWTEVEWRRFGNAIVRTALDPPRHWVQESAEIRELLDVEAEA